MPQQLVFTMLMRPSKAEKTLHGRHCLGDMAVRLPEELARPWIGVILRLSTGRVHLQREYTSRTHHICPVTIMGCTRGSCEGRRARDGVKTLNGRLYRLQGFLFELNG